MNDKHLLQDAPVIAHCDVVRNHFVLLGGIKDNFSTDIANRVHSFAIELNQKRNYEKFTTFASDCDEMIIENHLRLFRMLKKLLTYSQ
ncbi:MAG: hypothetical protein DLM72_08870 [Candidatus Nitrosopolaris wilkensis]|nr:MAG: hypothetical protein DLM72_08870 [Candidatus Nitrosopolaris wilkensis]